MLRMLRIAVMNPLREEGRSGTPKATFLAVQMDYHLTPTPKKSSHKIRRQVDAIVGRIQTPAVSHP